MYSILANVGLRLYLPYIMTYIFNFITETKKKKEEKAQENN